MKKDKVILAFTFLLTPFLYGQNEPIEIDTLTLKKHITLKKTTISSNISRKEIEKSSGENLANLLKNISGVTILHNGANISKPVIQGLTNQRVAILNNEVKIEGHHWGNDHSPEIDTFIAQRVEIIKGAEAVKYGANALGGVILLKSDPIPYFGEKVGGKIQAATESNSKKIAGNILLQGSTYKNNSFAWRVQTSAKKIRKL